MNNLKACEARQTVEGEQPNPNPYMFIPNSVTRKMSYKTKITQIAHLSNMNVLQNTLQSNARNKLHYHCFVPCSLYHSFILLNILLTFYILNQLGNIFLTFPLERSGIEMGEKCLWHRKGHRVYPWLAESCSREGETRPIDLQGWKSSVTPTPRGN